MCNSEALDRPGDCAMRDGHGVSEDRPDPKAEGFGMLDCRDFTNAALPSEQSRPGNPGNNIMVRSSRRCRSCFVFSSPGVCTCGE